MSEIVKQAIEHWPFVSALLRKPKTEKDYDILVMALDELLDEVGEDGSHALIGMLDIIGDWIEGYDLEHRPMPVNG